MSLKLQQADQKLFGQAAFSNVTSLTQEVSQTYCNEHTPTVIVNTISEITSSKGIQALNGVNTRYLSYKRIQRDHLYFNLVNAVVSGKDKQGKAWSELITWHEQTLSAVGETYTVWSTSQCKGTFLGAPTLVSTH